MWVMAGWDWGMQDNSTIQWHDFMVQYRYAFLYNKIFSTFRYEYFTDPGALFRPLIPVRKHQLHMLSLNFDYIPIKKMMLRAEANYLLAQHPIIGTSSPFSKNLLSFSFIGSIQIDYKK
jgi:hypothetical protein